MIKAVFEYPSFKVELFDTEDDGLLESKVYINGKLVHTNKDYRPSVFYQGSILGKLASLIDFYTLTKDDVEESYFIERDCPELYIWAHESPERDDVAEMIFEFLEGDLEEEQFSKYVTVHLNC